MATTDIISSLFSIAPALDPRSAELQARQDALSLGGLFGAAGVNEYATPERQQAYMNKQAAQFALADMGVRKLGGLFGLQTPELKRASAIEGALAGLQDELSAEQMQDPTQLYPALIKRLQGAGMDKEALMVAAKAAPEMQSYRLQQAQTAKELYPIRQEEKLRAELANLPPNASDEEYLGVVRKYAPAKDVMSTIEARQKAREAREGKLDELKLSHTNKLEQIKLQAEERMQQVIQQGQDRLEAARLQGATQAQIAQMQGAIQLQIKQMDIASRESIAAAQRANAVELAKMNAAVKARNAGLDDKAATAVENVSTIEASIADTDRYANMLKNNEVDYGFVTNIKGTASTAFGSSTENARKQQEIAQHIQESVNQLLLAAKGTQTEGDAQRAEKQIQPLLAKNDKESMEQALTILKRTKEKVSNGRRSYLKARGYNPDEFIVGGASAGEDPLGLRK